MTRPNRETDSRLSRRRFLRAAGLAAGTAALEYSRPAAAAAAKAGSDGSAPARPNILVILLDDMGWSDLGCYGGEVQTPNIDALAAGGLRFRQFYNTARCCPTRASLLTGLYPHQAGVGAMTFDKHTPAYRGFLQRGCVTLAEALRPGGYRTAMVGKWHLSLTREGPGHMKHLNNQEILDKFSDLDTYPVARGFEEHYGVIWGVVNHFDPFSLVHNTKAVQDVPEDYFITDAFTDHAVEYLEKYTKGDEPMLLYLAYTAPHWPLHARGEDVAKYKDTYRGGWQAVRKARYARQVKMGLIDPKTTALSERYARDHTWHDEEAKGWEARAMAVHAAMIDRVDQGVGKIVAKLKELGEYENTLIFVLSDNGASPERPMWPGFDRPSETRDGRPMRYYGGRRPRDVLPGPESTCAGIAERWANVANTPLRLWKATQHEGGIRTPLVVHWPAGLRVKGGTITDQVGHIIDIMATCVDVAGATYPKEYKGHTIQPVEGKTLLPIFQGRQRKGHEAIYFEHMGARAVRQGPWKLVSRPRGRWELYDLSKDGSETRDLAAEHPERVQAMADLWQKWARRCQVLQRNAPRGRKPRKRG